PRAGARPADRPFAARAQGGRGLISGVALVAKPGGPEGPTSHDVVDAVRRAVGTDRVGHLGTLDPFASGLLVLVLGRATRLAWLATSGKRWVAGRILRASGGRGSGRSGWRMPWRPLP